jgi:hypothetical protein
VDPPSKDQASFGTIGWCFHASLGVIYASKMPTIDPAASRLLFERRQNNEIHAHRQCREATSRPYQPDQSGKWSV